MAFALQAEQRILLAMLLRGSPYYATSVVTRRPVEFLRFSSTISSTEVPPRRTVSFPGLDDVLDKVVLPLRSSKLKEKKKSRRSVERIGHPKRATGEAKPKKNLETTNDERNKPTFSGSDAEGDLLLQRLKAEHYPKELEALDTAVTDNMSSATKVARLSTITAADTDLAEQEGGAETVHTKKASGTELTNTSPSSNENLGRSTSRNSKKRARRPSTDAKNEMHQTTPMSKSPDVRPKKREEWQKQKTALKDKFAEGWNPRKKLSPDTMEGIRQLNEQYPDRYTTPILANEFEVSPEVIRRVLKSKWRPSETGMEERRERWARRHDRIWDAKAEMGLRPPRRKDRDVEDPGAWEEDLNAKEVLRSYRG